MNALEALRAFMSDEAIISDAPQAFPEAASDGDYFRQGDVYIVQRDKLPAGIKPIKVELQLAPGTTKGSRHILDSEEGVEMFVRNSPNALQGPIFRLSCDRSSTHPEHGDVLCRAKRIYEVLYQRMMAKELKATRD